MTDAQLAALVFAAPCLLMAVLYTALSLLTGE
jgi:hypothetical protein